MQAFGGALSAQCPHLGRMGCRRGRRWRRSSSFGQRYLPLQAVFR